MKTRTGDEFTAMVGKRTVLFRAIGDEGKSLDVTQRRFVWATPIRPTTGYLLRDEMVVFIDDIIMRYAPTTANETT